MKHSNAYFPPFAPIHSKLTDLELKELLKNFNGWQQNAAIKYLAQNPGALTHEIHVAVHTNNFAKIKERTRLKLNALGYVMRNQKPVKGSPRKEERIFLCRTVNTEILEVGVAANDGGFHHG